MSSAMKALVPFLILLGIIFLVIFFLMWKKATDILKKPRKTQPPQPAQKREPSQGPLQEPFQPSQQPSEKQEKEETLRKIEQIQAGIIRKCDI